MAAVTGGFYPAMGMNASSQPQIRKYSASLGSIAVYIGDVVLAQAGGTVKPVTSAGAVAGVAGVVMGIYDSTGLPVKTAAASATGVTLDVNINPDTIYATVTNAAFTSGEAQRGATMTMTLGSPNTTTLISGHRLTGGAGGTTQSSGRAFMVVDKVDNPDNLWTSTNCETLVKIVGNMFATGTGV